MRKLLAFLFFSALAFAQPGANVGDTLPPTCVPGQLFVKTGPIAPGIYYCNTSGAWVSSGGGGAAGVISFNSRTGVVVPLSGDYSGFYSSLSHLHTGVYSPVSHLHTGVYEPADADIVKRNEAVVFTNSVDGSGATLTKPMKVGTTLPGTCGTGEVFFDSDAPAGSNVYTCIANVWSVISSGEILTAGYALVKASTTMSVDNSKVSINTSGTGPPVGSCTGLITYEDTVTYLRYYCAGDLAWHQYGSAGAVLPPQAGNSGKFLSTNGTDPLWATVSTGSTGSGLNYSEAFTSQTSVVINGIGTPNIGLACYDASDNAIQGAWSVSGSAPYDAVVTFTTAQTGRCVILGGMSRYAAAFSGAATYTVSGATHALGTCDVHVQIWDGATPAKRVEPDSVTCNSTSKDIVVAFATTQAGRLVIQ